jgi:hypothetical protein
MTLADYSVTAFTVINGARIVAYLPQIVSVQRDKAGASSVSMITWGIFFLANAATVSYALAVIGDRVMAAVFAVNAVACAAIFIMILRKRLSHAWSDGHSPAIVPIGQFLTTAWLSRLSRRAEDRIAGGCVGDRWSDTVEREINKDWLDYRCRRLP